MRSRNLSVWYDVWHPIGSLCRLVDYVHIFDLDLFLKDLWWENGWHMETLAMHILEEFIVYLHQFSMTSLFVCEDVWIWEGKESSMYTAATGYCWLTRNLDGLERTSWSWVWKIPGPKKFPFLFGFYFMMCYLPIALGFIEVWLHPLGVFAAML